MRFYQSILKNILKNYFECDVKKIKFKQKEFLKEIKEYNFYVLKYIVDINQKEQKEIYVKNIQPKRIKETIYCFEKLIEKNIDSSNSNIIITQEIGKENFMKINLSINNRENKCADIYFIKIKKEGKVKDFNLIKNETLFLGVKK